MREQDDRGRITFATRKAVKEAVEKAVIETQLKEKEAIALNLPSLGFSLEDTAKGTGLSVEQVEKLRAEKYYLRKKGLPKLRQMPPISANPTPLQTSFK